MTHCAFRTPVIAPIFWLYQASATSNIFYGIWRSCASYLVMYEFLVRLFSNLKKGSYCDAENRLKQNGSLTNQQVKFVDW